MRKVIAENLDQTGGILGLCTVEGDRADCRLVGNEIVVGIVDIRTTTERVCLRISADPKDFQRARIYEGGQLVESLLMNNGSVVYVDDAASRHATEAKNAAAP